MNARTEELYGPTGFAWSISAISESTKESQLPAKFPVIVDDLTGTIFEPGLLFLYEKYVEPKFGPFRYNTVTNYAHDLKEWCRHLEQYEVAWPKATRDDLNTFIKVMYVANSTETGKPYCTKTIIRRLVTVLQFYKWAQTAKFDIQNIPENGLLKSTDVDTEIEPRDEEKQHISYLDEVQRVEILRALGPYPDAWAASHYELASVRLDEPQSAPQAVGFINATSKDSLAALISISTGLRITEVCNLRLEHFSHVPQNVDALEKYPISVRGKGRKKRDVDFSGWLITQIRTYVQCERVHVMTTTGKADHGFVLLNPLRSRRFAGNKVNPRSIQRAFFDACVSTGYLKVEPKYVYKNIEGSICTEQVESIAPLFVFHDLRHTFAITTYFIRKYNSTMPDPDPIEYIRKMLGHESRDTTTDIYLARIDEIERKVGDKFIEYMNGKTSYFPL